MSDSSYAAATRHRRPYSTAGRPPVLDIVDDEWAADTLTDDEIDAGRHEAVIAPLLEEGDLDTDAVVVTTGNSASACLNAERRKKDEGWNDLGLDQFDTATASNTVSAPTTGPNNSGSSGQQQQQQGQS